MDYPLGGKEMSKVYSTIWAVVPDYGYDGYGKPEMGFTTEDEAKTWVRDHNPICEVVEIEVFVRSEHAD